MTQVQTPIGEDLTAVTMGLDRFERAAHAGDSMLDGEGLVPIYLGDALVEARAYKSWDAIFTDLARLAAQADIEATDPRGVFLRAMIHSLQVAARLFSGQAMDYAEKVRDLVGAPAEPVPEAEIAAHTDALDAALARAGFGRGSLRERVEAWEEAREVVPERIEAEFRELMAIARARTADLIMDPGDYDMSLNPVRGAPYTARCGFAERRMDLNIENRFTRAALKHLVAHEVFPGHATQLLYTLAEVKAGRSDADALLCTANAVTGCVQEGIGDQGVQLIDWIEDEDDSIHLSLRSLKSAAQTTAAWRLMVQGQAPAVVADYLRTAACGQEAWVQGRLRMASHPFRGPFITSYYAGNESVRRVRERVPPERRRDFVHYLYGRAHSPESLEMFDQEAGVA